MTLEKLSCGRGVSADLAEVLVPIEQCLTVAAGPVSDECLREAEAHGFDDLPLVEAGRVRGFLPLTRLRELAIAKEAVCHRDSYLKCSFVDRVAPVDVILEKLGSDRIVGVVGVDGAVEGIVTISDMNRHSFRAIIYPMLALLEERIARLIDEQFDDPWEWIGKVGDSRTSIVGHWECLKRDGLDVSATSGATLGQLLKVVEDTPSLVARSTLSKRKLSLFKNRALKYRNAVMHPTRPLVNSQEDVGSLREFLIDLDQMSKAFASC
ncbi:hypothetical protein [Luteimonas wenzhouensis]|uniref:CBS domain-containing protein n=1 Tax=Luteimonas wenzhouensis TaxID=2599615 RepID=A0A5C5TRE5_9GAMM|nr:hypothetical protein [Luteimonas wenzhouensis]TWT16843.1 hypothetical protein FQY79_15140 [Luteimonas wenzhouensis]